MFVHSVADDVGHGWAEPANAVSNLAFFIAAALLFARVPRVPASVWLLPILLAVIGLCSLSFHTSGTRFTGALDTPSILSLVLTTIVLYLHWMWDLPWR